MASYLYNRLGLNGKIILFVISCVLLAMAILTSLVIRQEIMLLESDGKKRAEILATTISAALKDNMLAGRTDDTVRLVKELSGIPGVAEISILTAGGNPAFGLAGDVLSLDDDAKWRMRNGLETAFSTRDSFSLVKPLWNEQPCRFCHPGGNAIRGAVVVKLSTLEITAAVKDLIRRMAGFGAIASGVLSVLLIILGRRLIVAPLRGLTEAARRISQGEYALFGDRSVRCREILNCGKTDCPSHADDAIPCWLRSGTLCTGEPVGDFAVKSGNCIKCRVYKEFHGDEIRQLEDGFNRMSLTLKKNEADLKRRVAEVNCLNRDLERNNVKLTTLLDASKLMTSTLELDQVLTDSMRIILNATDLKAGIILLLEEDLDKRCYEYFGCKAYNCPAYKAAVNCWLLSGTMCHGDPPVCPEGAIAAECRDGRRIHTHLRPARDYDEKMKACSNCEFFSSIVLIPRMTAGFHNGILIGDKLHLDGGTVHRALVMGQALVDYTGKNPFELPIETATEIAMPLKMQDKMIGILYLASDQKIKYGRHHTEFFQLLSEVISSGIFNSRLYDDIDRSYLQTVGALANAIEAKDPYTKGHSERVANLSIKMAGALGLSGQEKEHLNFAALLHDVGKIGINRDILRKDCALDKAEEEEMRSHPEKGIQILEPVHFLKPVLSSIRHHHERFDGTGYPLGLKGGEIPLKARILSIADTWDAMLSDRPYRAALSVEEAKKEVLKYSGTQFDPKIVEALVRCLGDAPGS